MYRVEKRDTAPLLSMLPTSKTLTIEEVELKIKLLIQTLCEVYMHGKGTGGVIV